MGRWSRIRLVSRLTFWMEAKITPYRKNVEVPRHVGSGRGLIPCPREMQRYRRAAVMLHKAVPSRLRSASRDLAALAHDPRWGPKMRREIAASSVWVEQCGLGIRRTSRLLYQLSRRSAASN